MTSYTDTSDNLHVILRDGTHYIARGANFTRLSP
jgi:hypothetical protein